MELSIGPPTTVLTLQASTMPQSSPRLHRQRDCSTGNIYGSLCLLISMILFCNYHLYQDRQFPLPIKVSVSCSLLYNFLCPKCHYFLSPTHSAKPNFSSFLELCSVSSTKVPGSFFVPLEQRVKVLAQHSKRCKKDGFSYQSRGPGRVYSTSF